MVSEIERTPSFPDALTWPQRAAAVAIRDQATYDLAAGMKLDLAALRKRIVEEFAPMKEAAHKAHKAITAKENEYLAPIEQAERMLVTAIKGWSAEQERRRIEEQRRLEAEARIAAEADRRRREAEAAAARAEAERAAAEIRKRDEEIRLSLALAALAAGDSEESVAALLDIPVIDVPTVPAVEEFMEPAAYIVPQVAAPTYDRMKGLGIPERWEAEITDMKKLCAAIGRGEVPEHYVAPTPALNSRVRSDKSLTNIPGVRAVKK